VRRAALQGLRQGVHVHDHVGDGCSLPTSCPYACGRRNAPLSVCALPASRRVLGRAHRNAAAGPKGRTSGRQPHGELVALSVDRSSPGVFVPVNTKRPPSRGSCRGPMERATTWGLVASSSCALRPTGQPQLAERRSLPRLVPRKTKQGRTLVSGLTAPRATLFRGSRLPSNISDGGHHERH
jgi:hypothetical protein